MKNNKLIIIVIIFIFTGIITGIQFKQKQSRTDIITMRNLYEEQKNIDNEKLEIEKLTKSIKELETKLDNYYSSEYQVDDIIDSLEKELDKQRLLAGLGDLHGPGVRIYMQDSEQFDENQNVNNFIIHNSDVLQIINDLRGAGAERLAINGTQVLWESEIDCNGATIRVGKDIFAPPFIIEAIGDPERLEGVLNAMDSVVQLMRIWDIQVHIEQVDDIVIKGIDTLPKYKYLKKVEEGEKE